MGSLWCHLPHRHNYRPRPWSRKLCGITFNNVYTLQLVTNRHYPLHTNRKTRPQCKTTQNVLVYTQAKHQRNSSTAIYRLNPRRCIRCTVPSSHTTPNIVTTTHTKKKQNLIHSSLRDRNAHQSAVFHYHFSKQYRVHNECVFGVVFDVLRQWVGVRGRVVWSNPNAVKIPKLIGRIYVPCTARTQSPPSFARASSPQRRRAERARWLCCL